MKNTYLHTIVKRKYPLMNKKRKKNFNGTIRSEGYEMKNLDLRTNVKSKDPQVIQISSETVEPDDNISF